MQIIRINPSLAGLRVDKFLCKNFDISFALAQKILREKKVLVNERNTDSAYKIQESDQIQILCELPKRKIVALREPNISKEKQREFWQNVVFEDENLVAIDKPSGLATQGGSGIDISVADFAKLRGFELVHRLDKDTSGLLLLAKNAKIAEFLFEKFKKRQIHKTYLALVYGKVRKEEMTISIPLCKKLLGKNEKVVPDRNNGKEAITELKNIACQEKFSLVELSPLTGRTHQLRVHCKEIGHPIIGDVKYGGAKTLIFKTDEGSKILENRGFLAKKIHKHHPLFKQISEEKIEPQSEIKSEPQMLSNKQRGEIIARLRRRLCLHAQAIVIENYFGRKLRIKTKKPEFLLALPM